MSTLGSAVYNALSGIAAVGGPGAPRVYRGRLPKPFTLPAIVYVRIDGGFEYAHDGDARLEHPHYQISCYAEDAADAEGLAEDVRGAMDSWASGTALPEIQRDLSVPEAGVWHVELEYTLWWRRLTIA